MAMQDNNPWQVPLIKNVHSYHRHNDVHNYITDTVLCDRCPTEFLPDRPPPDEAIHNVYEPKTQPELVRYSHAAAGFPTKPSWLKAIKNKQHTSWPGLTREAVNKHFPESEETLTGIHILAHICATFINKLRASLITF
jgi:hypothetical protein